MQTLFPLGTDHHHHLTAFHLRELLDCPKFVQVAPDALDQLHADLLVRYMLELTPEEQRALIGRTPTGAN